MELLTNYKDKDNMKNLTKMIMVVLAGLMVAQCSTYKIKPDMNKSGVVDKTPKWYVDYDHETLFKYVETGTAVSPDLELSVKKAVLLAKAKLVDRINGEVNNRTTITKNEAGTNEDLTVSAGSQDVIVNIIEDTLARGYEVKKQEIFLTKHKSYRAYVMVELSKKEVEAIIEAVNKKRLASIDVDAINKQADEILN
tara:strand:+ start:127 stop:714 length:588 start_codon:yes stop_codon:yes gene_type:complete